MLLESLLTNFKLSSAGTAVLWLIISQVNMLLCLVNDSLDMQLIEQDKFVPKNEVFSPSEAFKFVFSLFEPSLKIQKTKLSFHSVAELSDPHFL